jgi:excisionase family DNA binding protein
VNAGTLLTTRQAAARAAVAPSTIKRWADQGLLRSIRTPGGHRRIERSALEHFLRAQEVSSSAGDPVVSSWIACLVDGLRHEVDGHLLEARSRLGAWYLVADELGAMLDELGKRWACGQLTIAEEHMASDSLRRALARIGDTLPTRIDGPTCLLACAGQDDHTLGLTMAEVCLRESGWTPRWLGGRTPVSEIIRLVEERELAMVALSASLASSDPRALGEIAKQVGQTCAPHRVSLVLGGAGAWPGKPPYGVRLTSFREFHDYLTREERRSC